MTTPLSTDAVLRLLQQVGAEVVDPRFRGLDEHEISEKRPGDLVTAADHEAEQRLTEALLEAYPEAVVLGEEAYAEDEGLMRRYEQAEHAFTVDPVDGTKNFVRGSPDHAMMLAEVVRGHVERAWVWQPQHHAAYVAERGRGTWHNGERVTVAAPHAPARGAVSTRSWVGRRLGDDDRLAPLTLTWVCCGIDYPHLIAGDCDYLLYGHPKPWDHAPTSLLLTEAGGHVGTADGEPYTPYLGADRLIAAADRATYEHVLPHVVASG